MSEPAAAYAAGPIAGSETAFPREHALSRELMDAYGWSIIEDRDGHFVLLDEDGDRRGEVQPEFLEALGHVAPVVRRVILVSYVSSRVSQYDIGHSSGQRAGRANAIALLHELLGVKALVGAIESLTQRVDDVQFQLMRRAST